MLVLTRRANEAILLGDDIRITVLEVEGERVKIGIEAPQSLKILRSELLAEVRAFNREANQASLAFLQSVMAPEGAAADVPGSAEMLATSPEE